MKNNGDQNCCICNQSLFLIHKKFNCSRCNRPVCKYDRYLSESGAYLCEDCFSMEPEIKDEVMGGQGKVKEELQKVERIRNHYKEEIVSLKEATERNTDLIQSTEKIHAQKMIDLEQRLNQETCRRAQVSDINKSLIPILDQSKESLADSQKLLEKLSGELQKEEETQNELTQEKDQLERFLGSLQAKFVNSVNVVKLRSTLCRICYHRVKLEYRDLLVEVFTAQDRGSLVDSVVASGKEHKEKKKADPVTNQICKGCSLM